MTVTELIACLESHGFEPGVVHVQDANYASPSSAWLFGAFASAFERLKANLGSNNYVPEINDCDDFATLAYWYIRHLHRIQSSPKETSIAFGTMVYARDAGGLHAINIAITEAGKPVFFEPQTSREVQLSETEIFLCSDIRI